MDKKKKINKNFDLVERVYRTIKLQSLIDEGDEILVSVSGGRDSVTLLDILFRLKDRLKVKMAMIHYNFGLRQSESLRDENFVRELSKKYGIKLLVFQADRSASQKRKETVQQWARRIRRQKYRLLSEEKPGIKIALAHNLDDQVENFFIRLLRGGARKGLGGMGHKACGFIIRPLLDTKREEIDSYVIEKSLAFVEDSSNSKTCYFRNWIRKKLVPVLSEQCFYKFPKETVAKQARILKEEDIYLERLAKNHFEKLCKGEGAGRVDMDARLLTKIPKAIVPRVIRLGIEKISGTLKGISMSHVLEIGAILKNLKGSKEVCLPGGLRAVRNYETLSFTRGAKDPAADYAYENLNPPCIVDIPGVSKTLSLSLKTRADMKRENEISMDLEKFSSRISVRNFRAGDRIVLNLKEGPRKVKNIFINKKIPKNERKNIPFLLDGERIVCIPSVGIDCGYRPNKNTAKILELSLK